MAKICTKCNKKLGLFEKLYDNEMCKNCYEKKEEEESLKRQLEYLEKQKEYLRKKEEEEEKERQKREVEELAKATRKKEIDKYVRESISKYKGNYYKISYLLTYPMIGSEQFKEEYRTTGKVVSKIIDKIYDYLPDYFNLKDLKKLEILNTIYVISEQMTELFKTKLDGYTVYNLRSHELDSQKYAKEPNYNVLNESDCDWYSSYIVFYPDLVFECINHSKETYEHMANLICDAHEKMINNCVDYSSLIHDEEIDKRFFLFKIYYLIALEIVYMAYYSNVLEKFFDNKDFYTIYNNMKKEYCSNEEIAEKLFLIYDNLYKDEFDFELEQEDIECFIKILKDEEDTNFEEDFTDLNINTIDKLFDIDIDKFHCEKSEKELKNEIYEYYISKLFYYKNNFNLIDIIKNIELIPGFVEIKYKELNKKKAEIERDRLLKGEMYKEKNKVLNELNLSEVNDGYEFESFVSNLLTKLGYIVDKVTKKSGDQGADITAFINDKKCVIQTKYYSSPVGNKAVQEVVASKGIYNADIAMVITNNSYTKSAIELAKANNVKLIDGAELNLMIKKAISNIK